MSEVLALAARVADPERSRLLNAYEALWYGHQYDGMPSFHSDKVPLQERAPSINSHIAETAGNRLAQMVFGDRSFPSLQATNGELDVELTDDEKQLLSDVANRLCVVASLKKTMFRALIEGLKCGSLCMVCRVDSGRISVELLSAKDCTPTLDVCGRALMVDQRYRYAGKDNRGRVVFFWYRRVISALSDTVYEPVECRQDGKEPRWTVQSEVIHGFGFCPVIWHRNSPCTGDTGVDGSPLFEGVENEIRELDLAHSQRNRNSQYNAEPQMVVSGVDPEKPLSDSGPMPSSKGSWFSRVFDENKRDVTATAFGIKKSPAKIWKVPVNADAKLVESSGAGAKIVEANEQALKRLILELKGVVIASPEVISGNASAELLRAIYDPMLNVAAQYRDEYGDVLCKLLNMLLRVCAIVCAQGQTVLVRGVKGIASVMAKHTVMFGAEKHAADIGFTLSWGEYFPPGWTDISTAISAMESCTLLDRETKIRAVCASAGISDVESVIKRLDESPATAQKPVQATVPEKTDVEPVKETKAATDTPAQNAPAVDDVAKTALNGAQVTAVADLVKDVGTGALHPDACRELILLSFPSFPADRVDAMLKPYMGKQIQPKKDTQNEPAKQTEDPIVTIDDGEQE